jgi:UDP-N-acetylglucosamine 2-epimerase
MKVVTIIGTRPELIKLSRVIQKLDNHTEHVLVHTGQNYDYNLNEVFFKDLGLRKPDHFLSVARDSSASTIAAVIEESDKLFSRIKPDALLIYGDTNSCLCVIAAKRHKIPIFHMEAGNRCFDQRVPEEINRRIVDHLSDINIPLSEHARNYLIQEGIPRQMIIKSGSPMKEVLEFYRRGIENSTILKTLELNSKDFFIVSIHREENLDNEKNIKSLLQSLSIIATKFSKRIIVSTHPRTQKKISELNLKMNGLIQFLKPFGFNDYIKLQLESFCVISDSGTITEESSILSFPAITIRQAHERPEGMDEGTLIMTGLNPVRILEAIKIVTTREIKPTIVADYNVDNVSEKILNIIISYTDYINRTVWHKEF